MSERFQFDYHPDADQIGAFVEHALPAHEREQVLGHLAVCPECRAVVALSLPPVEAPKRVVAPARAAWWSGWTLASSAASMVAVVAVLIVYIHHSNNSSNRPVPPQIAEVRPVAPPAIANIAPVQIPRAPVTHIADRPSSARPVSAPPAAKEAPAPPNTAPAIEEQASANVNSEQAIQSNQNVVSGPISSQQVTSIATENRNFAALAALGLGVSSNKPAAAGNSATGTTTANADAENAKLYAASGSDEAMLQNKPLKHRLPSRLPVLSMAVHGRQMIAVDTGNAVFLSADAGKHWKPIQVPWSGRPVLVELASAEPPPSRQRSLALPTVDLKAPVAAAPSPSPVPARPQAQIPAPANGQTSSMTGLVTDQTGAVISGAFVEITNPGTGDRRTVMTDKQGLYVANGLQPGAYNLKAIAKGFESFAQSGIVVNVSSTARVDIKLTVGAETQTVTVEADALAVQVDSNVVSTLISQDQPAPIFVITTDQFDHWTSTDGIHWKRD